MDDIPAEVFLNIGKQMISNERNDFIDVPIQTKPIEEYVNNYK